MKLNYYSTQHSSNGGFYEKVIKGWQLENLVSYFLLCAVFCCLDQCINYAICYKTVLSLLRCFFYSALYK